MIHPLLRDYLEKLKAAGNLPGDEQITKSFKAAGWTDSDIRESLVYLRGGQAATPAPFVPPVRSMPTPQPAAQPQTQPQVQPVQIKTVQPAVQQANPLQQVSRPAWPEPRPAPQPVQPVVQQPAPQPIQQPQPVAPRPAAPVFAQPTLAPFVAPAPQPLAAPLPAPVVIATPTPIVTPVLSVAPVAAAPRSHKGPVIFAILLVLILAAGGFGAYAYTTGWGPFVKPPLDAKNIYASLVEHFPNVTSGKTHMHFDLAMTPRGETDTPLVPDLPLPAGVAPLDISATIDLTLAASFGVDASRTATGRFTTSIHHGTTTEDADIDFVTANNHSFTRFNSFSLARHNLAPVLGKWVEGGADAAKVISDTIPAANANPTDYFSQNSQVLRETLRFFATTVDQSGAAVLAHDPVLETADGVRLYRYDLTLNTAGVTRLTQLYFGKYNTDPTFSLVAQSPLFGTFIDTLVKNTTITLWVDAKTGAFVKQVAQMHFTPGGLIPGTVGKQLQVTATTELADLGKPVAVTLPTADIVPYDTFFAAFYDKSIAQATFEQQVAALTNVQVQLSVYKTIHAQYPAALTDLGALPASLPPYTYVRNSTGETYNLAYTVTIPPYTDPVHFPAGLVIFPAKGGAYLQYVSGTNTATPNTLSLEADAAAKIDTDKDKMSDSFEIYVGSNPKGK